MTNDLISRSELLKKSIRVSEFDEGGWERVLRAVPVEEIEAAEAVDAAPVVHCKDCKYRGETYVCPFRHIVFTEAEGYHFADCTTDDGYCSFGTHKAADNAQE